MSTLSCRPGSGNNDVKYGGGHYIIATSSESDLRELTGMNLR